ncbi:MAG TPA: hypothetical protein VMR81_00540 [Patescibacteria group bacterium]|nr:hypothetical protein [Patescibacteria group bacterium]
MKRFLTISCLLLSIAGTVHAASVKTASPVDATASAAISPPEQQIENLKQRLATGVAQLSQLERKAIVGTVKDVSVSTITVETKTSDIKIELVDGIKVFQTIKGKRTTLTTDDISKGDTVVVFGQYDATLDLLKAGVIVIQDPLPERIAGTVTDVDKKNYMVTVATPDGQSYMVDIENTTAMLGRDIDDSVIKRGFSKLQTQETVLIIGTIEPKVANRLSAVRFLDIGNLNAPTATPTPTPGDTTQQATPSATATPKTKATTTPTSNGY